MSNVMHNGEHWLLGPARAVRAAYAGVASLEASSAGRTRHRLNRGGNRRLNAILYRIVLTQAHSSEQARAYLTRRVEDGKTNTRGDAGAQALRCSSSITASSASPRLTRIGQTNGRTNPRIIATLVRVTHAEESRAHPTSRPVQ